MTTKSKRKTRVTTHRSKGDGAEKQALTEAVIEEEQDLSAYLEGYENTPFELVGIQIDRWSLISRQIAQAKGSAQIKYLMANSLKKGDRQPLLDEAHRFEDQMEPLLKELGLITQQIVDHFASETTLWNNVRIWTQVPRNLRKLIGQGLERYHDIKTDDIFKKVNALIEEQEKELIRV